MASLSNINGLFDVHSTGAILFSTSHGTTGQILRSNGDAAPTWINFNSTGFGGDYVPIAGNVTIAGPIATAAGISLTVGGRINGVLGGTLYNTAGLWLEGDSSTDGISIGGTDAGDKNIDTYGGALNLQETAQNGVNMWGNVGIGTNSPDTQLHIYNSDTNWGAYSIITLGTDVEGTNEAELKYYRGAAAATESFQLAVRGTTALTALYNGNVGIGTNTPFGKVDIQYDMDVDTGSITGLTAGVSQYGNINFSGVLAQGAGAASTSMQGITWQVNNYLGSTNYGNQAQIVVGNNGSVGTFMGFFTSGNYGAAPVEAIRIDSSQNVGIGTPTPDLGGVAGTRVLTIASPTAERWGILELAGNRTWGGNQVGELKFISTDATNNGTLVSLIAINDPTATGTGGSLKFNTRPDGGTLTERMVIDSSGFLNLSDGAVTLNKSDGTYITFNYNGSTRGYLGSERQIFAGGSQSNMGIAASGDFVFGSGASYTERMRITSVGEVLIGGTVSGELNSITMNGGGGYIFARSTGASAYFDKTSSDGAAVVFRREAVEVGTISVAASSTAYNTSSSDKRLKKNITNWNENILDKFKDIKPKEFNFNNQDDSEEKIKGYIAQNEVDKFPEAYPLLYNEEAGEDRHQFNPSGMVVYLMKAIQELEARVKELENK